MQYNCILRAGPCSSRYRKAGNNSLQINRQKIIISTTLIGSMRGKAQPRYAGDTLSPKQRSERMRSVRARDTKPELIVRQLIFGMGYRYRLHSRKLPGNPDIVFARRKKLIFVHGCFWHRHKNCNLARLPKSRFEFWIPKLEGNRIRDNRKQKELKAMGWRMLIVWECQLTNRRVLEAKIRRFLEDN